MRLSYINGYQQQLRIVILNYANEKESPQPDDRN